VGLAVDILFAGKRYHYRHPLVNPPHICSTSSTVLSPEDIFMGNSLLIDDRPIMFLPKLANALGSVERAIVLQQIHWLLRQPNSGVWEDNLHWVYGTYDEWVRDYFTMWVAATLKYHIRKLEAQGVLISAQLWAHKHDQTKFYRIDYAHELLAATRNGQDVIPSSGEDIVPSSGKEIPPSIYSTKTSSENTAEGKQRPQRGQEKKNYRPDEYSDIILG
jgi:hypothetical protein